MCVCEEKCTGAELVLFCMLDASGRDHNKHTIYDSCARKGKFSIIMKENKWINRCTDISSQCVMTYLLWSMVHTI